MSVCMTTHLIKGFALDVVAITKSVTWYNPDTGKAYNKMVFDYFEGACGEFKIINTKNNSDALCEGETYQGLTVFKAGISEREIDNAQMFLGLSLGRVDSDGIDCDKIATLLDKPIYEFVRDFGDPKLSKYVNMYLVSHVSY